MDIFISTIIPTIGRDTLSRAVQSVLDQHIPETNFEVIVVNDSGHSLSTLEWQHAPNLKIIHTNRRERSVARNAGAAIAKGKYLHFLDDDDWLLPGAFAHFWELTRQKLPAMIYGGYRFVDPSGKILKDCYPDEAGNCFIRFMSGEWQPLQTSLFDARIFHTVGGFASLESLRGGDEDVDLTRRISLEYDIAGVSELIATIRLDRDQSTTNYANLHEQSRQSRDLVLNMPGAFNRLRQSARDRKGSPAYWHGRMVWIYLGSVIWNLQKGNLSIAFGRVTYLILSLISSFRYWHIQRFWRGATRPHQTQGWLLVEK